MSSTPEKTLNNSNICVTPTLTPFRFLQSPKTPSNYNDVKTRLDIIITSIQENYAKWQLAEKRGQALCNTIEAIKTRALNAQRESKPKLDATLYPGDLKPYCDNLAVIVGIFADIKSNTQRLLRQLRSLTRLPGCSDEIFYRTWHIDQYLQFLEFLDLEYSKEYVVKKLVMEELPHCTKRDQLIRHATAWEYPQYVDENVALMFKFLAEEVKLKT